MKNRSIALTALCVAGLVGVAQAQTSSPDSSSGTSSSGSKQSSTSSGSAGSQTDWSSKHGASSGSLSATGRGGQDIQASKLMSAPVKASSGDSNLGTINDVIINPTSGRVDFAIISVESSGSTSGALSSDTTSPGQSGTSAASSRRSPGSTGTSGSLSSSTGGKLVAVPWSLIRSSGSSAYGSTSTTSGSQVSFVFNGDQSKLQGAPTFDPNSDLSQPSWRQSVYSYFGTSPSSSTGGATSPGGIGTSSSEGSGGSLSTPGSSSSGTGSSTSPNSSSSTIPQSSSGSTGSASKP